MRRCYIDIGTAACPYEARYSAKLAWWNGASFLLCEQCAAYERDCGTVIEVHSLPREET